MADAANALKEPAKLLDRQPGVLHDSPHRKRLDRIVTRNRDLMGSVGHDDVLSLPDDGESCPFEGPDRVQMIDPGNLRHR